jgi:hypothetical protein
MFYLSSSGTKMDRVKFLAYFVEFNYLTIFLQKYFILANKPENLSKSIIHQGFMVGIREFLVNK